MQQRWQSLDRYAAQSYLLTQDDSRNNNAGGPPSSNRWKCAENGSSNPAHLGRRQRQWCENLAHRRPG